MRVIGTDGKTYPDRWLSPDDRAFLAGAVHHLHHDERLSVRQILTRIEADHGVRRSVGWAAGILKAWRCDHCSGDPNATPEHLAAERSA
jgi:hypothetical protein